MAWHALLPTRYSRFLFSREASIKHPHSTVILRNRPASTPVGAKTWTHMQDEFTTSKCLNSILDSIQTISNLCSLAVFCSRSLSLSLFLRRGVQVRHERKNNRKPLTRHQTRPRQKHDHIKTSRGNGADSMFLGGVHMILSTWWAI